jgi:capsular polysaccharide biosynthesis protein
MRTDGPGGPLAAEGTAADPPIDLRRMREAIRRNGALVAGAVLAVMGVVFIASVRAPERFAATARIAGDGAALSGADPSTVATGLATNRELVTAPAVLQAAAHGLPGESAPTLAAAVSASVQPDASILDVTATTGEPRRAARIANAVAASFLARRASDRSAEARRARATLTKQLQTVRGTTAAGTLATALRERISDLALQEATAGSDLRLAEAAAPPRRPSAPRPLRSALLAGLAALLIAVTAAVIRDRARRRGAEAAELAARAGIPLLAVLPRRRRRGRKSDERLVVEQAALQGAVRAALPAKSQRVLVVCDIAGGEGAGWVAEGLARSLTWARQDAAVVRADASPDPDAELELARRERRRYVIVVGPAVTGSALLPLLACHATAAILVGRLDRTSAGEVATATQLLGALDMHPLGLVLTASAADAAAMRERGFEAAAPPPRRIRRDASRHNGDASEHWPRELARDGDPDPAPRQIAD